MGGRLGLKGTDGDAYLKAVAMGASPVSPQRASSFLARLPRSVKVMAPNGLMGEVECLASGVPCEVISCARQGMTTSDDTKRCASVMVNRGVDLIVFVGGDGTARDVASVVGESKPVLGVPSGVKMYSGVFAETPAAAARAVEKFLAGEAGLTRAEVLDVDEESFRRGELRLRLYGYVLVPSLPEVVTVGKDASPQEEEELESIARYVVENMEPHVLYILGPGTSVAAIAKEMGLPKTLLGFDAVYDGSLVGSDLNEGQLLSLVRKYGRAKVILSPIGGQGFIIGRGNQQLSPQVIREVGLDNIIIIATKGKLARLRKLRVDTGDEELDSRLRGYRRVIVGYGEEAIVKVE